MARLRTVDVAALNVRVHPHSPSMYAKLLGRAFSLRRPLNIQGDRYMLFERIDLSRNGDGIVSGTIARFTKIDPNSPWFDSIKSTKAEDDDIKKIRIPDHLQPNYKSIFFLMDIRSHILVFEQRNADGLYISPKIMLKFFTSLFSAEEITEEFHPVKVNLVTDSVAISQLLSMPGITKLRIFLQKPNPDYLDGYDADLERRLDDVGAKSVSIEYVAESRDGLKPDEAIQQAAKAAATNGDVEATAPSNSGRLAKFSSQDYPVTEGHTYDPDLRTHIEAFIRAATSIIKKISDRIGPDGVL